jgi:hypothetical protein
MSKKKYTESFFTYKDYAYDVVLDFINFIHAYTECRVYENPIYAESSDWEYLLVPADVTDEEFLEQFKNDNKDWVDEQIESEEEWVPTLV